jgi:hypothetical protein
MARLQSAPFPAADWLSEPDASIREAGCAQFLQLAGFPTGEVVRFADVGTEVVQFPAVAFVAVDQFPVAGAHDAAGGDAAVPTPVVRVVPVEGRPVQFGLATQ